MGRRGDPPEFRRRVLDLVEAGRPIAEVAQALGISGQSIYSWRRQDRIDRGLEPGLTSGEQAELAVAKRRIVELETELQAMRRAMELVREVVPQKAVPSGRGDGRRAHPGRGRLAGAGRVDLGLLRLPVPAAIGADHPPWLADRPHRRGPPALPWHLRHPAGVCRAAPCRGIMVGHNAVALLMGRAGLAGVTGRPSGAMPSPTRSPLTWSTATSPVAR